jgi:uncharacterized protein
MTSTSAKRLRTIGYDGVVIVTDGPFADRIADVTETYLSLAPDDILHGFRLAAGQPSTGNHMSGWAAETSHMTFGQWVGGLARLGASTRNPEATARSIDLIDGWEKTLRDRRDPRMELYAFEKVANGLVDAAEYAGYAPAIDLLGRLTEWAEESIGRSRRPAKANDFVGGPNATGEWYTLSEAFYRAFTLTGEGAYREFADVWQYGDYWDRFLTRPERGQSWDVPVWLHAYSHLNTFASVAARYRAKGVTTDIDILRNSHDYFRETQTYATGGYGPSELTVPEDGTLGRSLEWRTDSAEIVCGSWAVFKLCSALLVETGEARYGDWIERLLYSGIGAVSPVRADGLTPYYHDYRLGTATKLPHWDRFPCCSGTYIENIAHLPDLIYFVDESGAYVNLYVPSRAEIEIEGTPVTLTQTTSFPEGDSSEVVVAMASPTRFTLRFRVPEWSSGLVATTSDGATFGGAPVDGWLEVDRLWSPGDSVTVSLGAHLIVDPIDRWHPNRVALRHGPVVLAQHADWRAPLALPVPWDMVDLDAAFERTEGLTYTPRSLGTARLAPGDFVPLRDVPDRAPYRVYSDVDRPRIL